MMIPITKGSVARFANQELAVTPAKDNLKKLKEIKEPNKMQ